MSAMQKYEANGLKFYDRADEFRMEVVGRFAGKLIAEARAAWESTLREKSTRRITLDITYISGYDLAGRKLLQELQRHGVTVAAGTPLSLVFLQEISSERRHDATTEPDPAFSLARAAAPGD